MAYRIVQEKWSSGYCYYRVEHNNGLMGLRKKFGWWKTCQLNMTHNYKPAVFGTLKEAEQYVEQELNHITEKNIMSTYN